MRDEYDFSQARRGPVIDATGKTRITIYLDDEVLAAFRERAGREGKGYQTLINETLRAAITPEAAPVTVEALRRVLREELRGAA
ncbi:MAG TPA: BrnA antitoxin family protein [Xanthomonadaceae bacterium]|nr:BrnA antitoxin family protein [Xanthomonadaceae bacterium]